MTRRKYPLILTPETVRAYHSFMADEFDFEFILKSEVQGLRVVNRVLETMGIEDRALFLNRYAITIVDPLTGRKWVYIPWNPGAGSQTMLGYQVRILAHECEHTVQANDPRFYIRYFGSRHARANLEALAGHPELEIWFYLQGYPINTAHMADRLKKYRVRSGDRRVAKVHLDIYNKIACRGHIASIAGKKAIRFLKSA